MSYVSYIFFRFIIFGFKIMPMRIVYLFSDFTAFVLFRVVGYRKKVAYENLKRCFPSYSEKEIQNILKKTYTNLADMFMESIKGMSMSHKRMASRFNMLNLEVLKPFFDRGQSIIGLTAHYGNWEWGAAASTAYLEHGSKALYKPLSNKILDEYMRRNRARFGLDMVSIKETGHMFREKTPKPMCYFLVADQNPSNPQKAFWVDFFGIETGFLHGPEVYARLYELPVLYFEVERKKRGFYDITIYVLAEKPNELPEGEISLRYAEIVEKIIRKKPEDWVWTHKRWKNRRPENKPLFSRK